MHSHDHAAHGAGHQHCHSIPAGAHRGRLALVLALVILYLVAETIGGLLTGSLALLADAGHMLSDAAALGLSLFALWIAERPATAQKSFGYYRAEILAALANGAALLAICIVILIEAVQRLTHPAEVEGGWMLAIAAGGLFVNLIGLGLLHSGRSASLNLRGAWLHVLTDALGSVAALVAGVLIWWRGWQWSDPIASVLIGLLASYSAWNLVQEAVAVLMESVPGHLDLDEIRNALRATPGVREVHDLHVWTIGNGLESLSAHIVQGDDEGQGETHYGLILQRCRETLEQQFGIHHVTIQVEPPGFGEPGCHFER